jgi:hypothetical protein
MPRSTRGPKKKREKTDKLITNLSIVVLFLSRAFRFELKLFSVFRVVILLSDLLFVTFSDCYRTRCNLRSCQLLLKVEIRLIEVNQNKSFEF